MGISLIISWVFHWSLCNNFMGISFEFMSISCLGLPQLTWMHHKYFMGDCHSNKYSDISRVFHAQKNSWHFHRRNIMPFHGIFMAMLIPMNASFHGSATTEKPMIYLWFYFIAKSWKFHGLSWSTTDMVVFAGLTKSAVSFVVVVLVAGESSLESCDILRYLVPVQTLRSENAVDDNGACSILVRPLETGCSRLPCTESGHWVEEWSREWHCTHQLSLTTNWPVNACVYVPGSTLAQDIWGLSAASRRKFWL